MTPRETGELIVQRWRMEHDPTLIMMQCIALGSPLKRADVLAVIRAYIDGATENRALKISKN
jgi:hypothetical protein